MMRVSRVVAIQRVLLHHSWLRKQEMLMDSRCSNEGLASLRLVDALDEVLFLEGFERAIHGDQALCRMCFTCLARRFLYESEHVCCGP